MTKSNGGLDYVKRKIQTMTANQPFIDAVDIPDELTDARDGAAIAFLRKLHAVLSEIACKPGLESLVGSVCSGIGAESVISRDFNNRSRRGWARTHGSIWHVAELKVTTVRGSRAEPILLMSDDFRDGGIRLGPKLVRLCEADPEFGVLLAPALTQALGVDVSYPR